MFRKIGEKVGDFFIRLKKPERKSGVAQHYIRFIKEGVQKEYAFRSFKEW